MRLHPFILAALSAGALAAAAPAPAATAAPGPAGTERHRAQDPDPGRTIFQGKGNCFTCHRQDARGTPLAPDLTDAEWIAFDQPPTVAQLETLIREGVPKPTRHPAPMPPMGGARLSPEEVTQVARYVLGLSSNP